jgi:hypothetical protein
VCTFAEFRYETSPYGAGEIFEFFAIFDSEQLEIWARGADN